MKPELSLVEAGRVTAEDYLDALRRQDEETPPLGQVAIEEGLLGPRDVFEILHEQNRRPGRRFGEVAIALGRLDRPSVALLLLMQLERRRSMLELFFEQGAISEAEAAEWLAERAETHGAPVSRQRHTPAELTAAM